MYVDEVSRHTASDHTNFASRYSSRRDRKNGWTLLHRAAVSTPRAVHQAAKIGVPINAQNSDGDTALHVAVKANNYDTVEALVQCGADLTSKNKLAQTPLDIAHEPIRTLLHNYQPGPLAAFLAGNSTLLARILHHFWCNVNCIIQDDMSLLDLSLNRNNNETCSSIVQEFRPIIELVHSVLSENVGKLQELLSAPRKYPLNIRFNNAYGKTLLAYAVDNNSLEVIKLLVQVGAKIDGIRCKESGGNLHSSPLFHRSLKPNIDMDIVKYLHSVQNKGEIYEKDMNGNTALLRAVEEGAELELIEWLLNADRGFSLAHRNMNGMTARDLALFKGHTDIVQLIDKFIFRQRGRSFFLHLAIKFYGFSNLHCTEQDSSKTFLEVLESEGFYDDIKTLRHFDDIEKKASELFEASAQGNLEEVKRLNSANFQDKNGYTALIKAIVHGQVEIVRFLANTRPDLKVLPDNCNHYPLHYAYALPEEQSKIMTGILLENKPEEIEKKADKDGIYPAEYIHLRESSCISQMLIDVRSCDVYGQRRKFD